MATPVFMFPVCRSGSVAASPPTTKSAFQALRDQHSRLRAERPENVANKTSSIEDRLGAMRCALCVSGCRPLDATCPAPPWPAGAATLVASRNLKTIAPPGGLCPPPVRVSSAALSRMGGGTNMPRSVAKIPRTTRAGRTKAEVQEEFAQIAEEVESQEPADPKTTELGRRQEAELRAAVDGVSVDGVVQKITHLGLEISRSLTAVSERLVEQVQQLDRVRQAVQLEKTELERLHKIDVAATALDQLVAEHRAQQEKLEAEHVELEASRAQEDKERERLRKEQEDALRKARDREAEEYEYKKSTERKKAQDKFDEQMQKLDKQNREKQEAQEKDWAQREASLKAREEELAVLRKDAETFPARLKKEVDAAVAAALETAKRQSETERQLMTKDLEGDRRAHALQLKALEETVAKQAVQLADLQQQLASAQKQVQDIAVRALDSAAGAKTLEEVRSIAREQAKREAR
jgi:hypothetical protein